MEKSAKELAEMEAASRLDESERSAKERAEKKAARRAMLKSLSRCGLLRPPGSILLTRDNSDEIRDTVDFGRFLGISSPEEKVEFLATEKIVWDAAMNFLKSKDISSECDLIPDTMSIYPMVFKGHDCYHCNIMGQKRDTPILLAMCTSLLKSSANQNPL